MYPTWRYHRHESPCIVHNEAEDKALGEGWADSPVGFESVLPEEPKTEPSCEPTIQAEKTEEPKPEKRSGKKSKGVKA